MTNMWPCFNCITAPFYLQLFGFLLGTTTVLTTSTAHTCTYTVVRYCSITELAPVLDEGRRTLVSCRWHAVGFCQSRP